MKERLKPSMRIYSISRAGNIIVDPVGLLEIAFSYSSKFQLSRFLFCLVLFWIPLHREAEMRDVSEKTNARVAWFSMMSVAVCIAVSALQLWHLKRFFEKKKLI